MEKALIFHSSDEKKIIETCKYLFLEKNMQENSILPIYPLYTFLTSSYFSTMSLKDIKQEILEVNICSPKIENSDFFFPVEICLKNKKVIFEKIIAGRVILNGKLELPAYLQDFPFSCKIFKAANVKLEKNYWEVYDNLWIKKK